MITAGNYFEEVQRMGIENLPETLKKGHDLVVRSTASGTNWSTYQNSESIRKVIDLYFQKLFEYASSRMVMPDIKAETPVAKKTTKRKSLKAKVIKTSKAVETTSVRHVEHIGEEVKFIKRYVGLHNKVKSPNAILAFIKALQRSIVQKLIRKTSSLSDEIRMIQDKLVQAYNKMKGEESFAINEKDLSRLVAIAGGEAVYPSITIIKRFIGLQGKDDEKKVKDFLKYLDNVFEKEKLPKDDPYVDKVRSIYKNLKNRTSSKVAISKAELSGLQSIIMACSTDQNSCGCANPGAKSKTSRKVKGLNGYEASGDNGSGVLTAQQMATRKLDLLPFTGAWKNLFGNPARNFTMMFHGEPHNGKTIFLLKLAQYLAESFGNVLYVSSEEFASPTMTQKVAEFLNPLPARLHFAENLTDPELENYQFIILDSVNDLGLRINEYKNLRRHYPDKAFVFILQHTKAGDFRGGKDWEHTAEIVGEVEKGVVNVTKNRYAPKNTMDFFKQFGLTWQEPKVNSSKNIINN